MIHVCIFCIYDVCKKGCVCTVCIGHHDNDWIIRTGKLVDVSARGPCLASAYIHIVKKQLIYQKSKQTDSSHFFPKCKLEMAKVSIYLVSESVNTRYKDICSCSILFLLPTYKFSP